MAMTSLDAKTALIVVDLQQGIMDCPTVNPIGEVVKRAGMLANAFRDRDLPVVLTRLAGSPAGRTEWGRRLDIMAGDRAEFVPELASRAGDHVVEKRTWSAFWHTDLERYLDACGVSQVVLAGVATSIGVESTARDAHALGFHVSLAVDAMADTHAGAHHNSIVRIFPRLGEAGSCQEVLSLLRAPVAEAC